MAGFQAHPFCNRSHPQEMVKWSLLSLAQLAAEGHVLPGILRDQTSSSSILCTSLSQGWEIIVDSAALQFSCQELAETGCSFLVPVEASNHHIVPPPGMVTPTTACTGNICRVCFPVFNLLLSWIMLNIYIYISAKALTVRCERARKVRMGQYCCGIEDTLCLRRETCSAAKFV